MRTWIARTVALLSALALFGLGLPGCTGDRAPGGASIVDVVIAQIFEVTPPTLTLAHQVGTSPCPQFVGRISIRNLGQSARTATITVVEPSFLFATASAVDVPGNGTAMVDIYFDCGTRSSFNGRVLVSDAGGFSQEVAVRATILP